MSDELYRPVDHVDIRHVADVPRESAIRLYRTQAYGGGQWALQVRAVETLSNGREGRRFLVGTASLDSSAIVALRDAIDTHLGDDSLKSFSTIISAKKLTTPDTSISNRENETMKVYTLYREDEYVATIITNDDVEPSEQTIARCKERGYAFVHTGHTYATNAGMLDDLIKDEIDAYEENY